MNLPGKDQDIKIFRQIASQSDQVYFIYDLTSQQITYINSAFKSIWRQNPDAYKQNPAAILDTIYEDDKQNIIDSYQQFLAEKTRKRVTFRIAIPYKEELGPDKGQKWVDLTVHPLGDPDNVRLVAGIVTDDTERKNNVFMMQKINARKDSILEILAYDLRGPIGIVQVLASMMQEKLSATGDEEMVDWVKNIEKICKRSVDLIRNMVNQEFLESPEVEMYKERLDIVWEMKEVVDTYQHSQEKLAKVFELTSSAEKIYAHVDSLKFMQVINNLISNALKFTPDNGIIQVHIEEKEATVLVTVKDNGIGIPAKYHPVLFDKFTRARRPGLRGEEATGLGMSIIKLIVDLHGGDIWFESEENKGTIFFIEIPKE